MKSVADGSFYVPGQGPGSYESTPATGGPWSRHAQHGGPPSALLTRALEDLIGPEQVLARISVDLLGPVPVGTLSVRAEALRRGRQVQLLTATLYDVAAGRDCAVARAWALPRSSTGPGVLTPPGHSPADGVLHDPPASWSRGYVQSVEWRWIKGAVTQRGPATVWMRPRIPLLPGVPLTGLDVLMTCVDSASGASAALDPSEWAFLNTELTVTILREPVGEWVCLDAVTALSSTAVGIATSDVYDQLGLVARSSQTLLVQRQDATK
jgi:hypothetical protein